MIKVNKHPFVTIMATKFYEVNRVPLIPCSEFLENIILLVTVKSNRIRIDFAIAKKYCQQLRMMVFQSFEIITNVFLLLLCSMQLSESFGRGLAWLIAWNIDWIALGYVKHNMLVCNRWKYGNCFSVWCSLKPHLHYPEMQLQCYIWYYALFKRFILRMFCIEQLWIVC